MVGPLGGVGAEDLEVSIINVRKHRRRTLWEVPELRIQERPPPTLRIDDCGAPLGGAGAGDPKASTINVRKHRRRPPWEVPELKIQERSSPMLRKRR
jgi:hypothetical protein